MPELARHIRPRGPRCWEGLAGVTYPAESTSPTASPRTPWGQEEAPAPKDWSSTAAVAKILHLSHGGARAKLRRAGLESLRARGTLYWRRQEVEKLAQQGGYGDTPPAEWQGEQEALRALQCGRTTLWRIREKRKMRLMRVTLRGVTRIFYHRDDVSTLRGLLQQQHATEKALSEWR